MTVAESAAGVTGSGASAGGGEAIRPFHINVAQADLDELRRRVVATRWSSRETVPDQSQGVQLAKLKELVQYWGTGYDWRKVEARVNARPRFMTEIDGLDIHLVHVRSKHPNALPMIITHGWPGSFMEMLKVIGPLTAPTARGALYKRGSGYSATMVTRPQTVGYGLTGLAGRTRGLDA